MDKVQLFLDLKEDEGKRKFPYRDTVGKLSIGIGRNLTDRGLLPSEIEFLFLNDIAIVEHDLDCFLPWWRLRPETVQRALVNLCFNMGIIKLLKFKNTLRCIELGQYGAAVANLKKSLWFKQVQKSRSDRIFRLLRRGINE